MTTLDYQTSSAPGSSRSLINWRDWLRRLGPLVGLVFVFGLFSVLRPARFLNVGNLQIMLLQTAVVGTAALGMTIIIISGGIDLSVGSNIALVTVVVALLLNSGAPPLAAAVGGIFSAMLVGLLIGVLITTLRLSSFIVTLGLWGAVRGAAKGIADNSTIVPHRDTWLNLLLNTPGKGLAWMVLPPGVWMTLVLSVLVAAILRYTKFGRHVFAIGSNAQTARLCGINTSRTLLLIYVVGALFAGVAGVLQFSYLTLGDPTTAVGKELDVIAAVVIGGASLSGGEGSILGSLIGALIMTAVANGCQKMDYPNWVQEIVTGAIIILAVALDQLRHLRSGRSS